MSRKAYWWFVGIGIFVVVVVIPTLQMMGIGAAKPDPPDMVGA